MGPVTEAIGGASEWVAFEVELVASQSVIRLAVSSGPVRGREIFVWGASVDRAQNPSQDNLSLPSAGEPRAAPFDASPA